MSLLALQDLFRRYREKATGVWTLGKDPGRTIYIDYGDAVFAQSTHLQDRLTYLLVERGKVTQAQMDYALANLKPGLSIGKNLIEMGFITQRDLLETAKSQVERIIRGALACPDLEPSFEERELDANVVRLPMNTAQLFLTSTLALQDREGLLELLGPLNQVVLLQGRNLMDLTLPPDLAKLPPLLDGTHTLLELSRESMAEPLRLGAFALFLREMGWARLHEMPPLDRQALDLALAPEPEPLSPPLPDLLPETVPTLFSTIQEAARPTTNLEHLSQALDQEAPAQEQPAPAFHLPEAPARPEPPVGSERVRIQAVLALEPGQGYPPTPALPIEEFPDLPEDGPIPLVLPLEDQTTPSVPLLQESPSSDRKTPAAAKPRSKGGRGVLAALLLLACLGAGGWVWYTRAQPDGPWAWLVKARVRVQKHIQAWTGWPALAPAPRRPPAPAAPVSQAAVQPPSSAAPAAQVAVPAPASPVAVPTPAPAKPAAPASPVAVPTPAPAKPAAKPATPDVTTSIPARVQALNDGDLDLAVRQGRLLAKEIPPGQFTLRLEIACQGPTIQRLMELFKAQEPDIFLLPIALKDGRVCYQVLYGRYSTQKAAETDLKRLPAPLLADHNQPKVFRFSDVPKLQ